MILANYDFKGTPYVECDLRIAEETRDRGGCMGTERESEAPAHGWLKIPLLHRDVCPRCAAWPLTINAVIKLLRGPG